MLKSFNHTGFVVSDIERRLGQGIRHRDADRLALEIQGADLDEERKRVTEEELEAARDRKEDLKAQIKRCDDLLKRSSSWVGFDAEPFREARTRLNGSNGIKPV